ncbi:MAG: response regulator transcription factor [Christensenella sp.]|nr:response regulator transcription factor [Christensenella sp.]
MRILIVEDEHSLQNIIVKHLKEEGYLVDGCTDGQSGLDYAIGIDYDCIILDIMLPKMNGLDVLRELRSNGKKAAVLLLTAMDSIEDRVAGLDAGADDYLVKPFSFEELMARVRALLRRQNDTKENILTLADLSMDVAEHKVTRGGQAIILTSKEYALLEYLLRNTGRMVTRSQIMDHVWNYDFDYESNIVDVYIRYLRGKIDRDFEPKLICTIRGYGYVMREENE